MEGNREPSLAPRLADRGRVRGDLDTLSQAAELPQQEAIARYGGLRPIPTCCHGQGDVVAALVMETHELRRQARSWRQELGGPGQEAVTEKGIPRPGSLGPPGRNGGLWHPARPGRAGRTR